MLYKLYKENECLLYNETQWNALLAQYPLLTAAGGAVRNPCGETLMIFKRGKWDLPKGTLEKGETLVECALREVQEECGVEGLTITAPLLETCHIYLETDGIEYIKRTHWYRMECNNCATPRPQAQEEITQAVWALPEQVKENLRNSYLLVCDIFDIYEK